MENITILIVDDESRIRKLLNDFLVKENFKILEAEDGEKALNVFEKNKEKMLTARTEEQDALFGYELGVDEYILKPFSPKILVAKIKAFLSRTIEKKDESKNYGGIIIDPEGRTVTIDGKNIDLSLREYELLKYLLDNEGVALSRDKILNNVWNYDYYGDSRTIDSHIKKIRHKLGKRGKYIKTMRGVGYKFEVK